MKNNVTRVMLTSVITNIFLALMKVISGIIFKSGALISDGIHSFSDLITDIFAIIGGVIARKPADREHPYGHGKAEYLTSLVIGVVIIIVGGEVIYTSINKDIIIPSIFVVVISLITIIAKLLLSSYIIHQGKKLNNSILIASGKESRTDVISSIVVLISAILMQFGKVNKIFEYSDLLASIIVGLFIINIGINIIKENASNILGEQETDRKYIAKIKKSIKKIDGVLGIRDLVILKFGHKSSLNLTITMDGNITLNDAHNKADLIEQEIKDYSSNIEYINIHIEPYQSHKL